MSAGGHAGQGDQIPPAKGGTAGGEFLGNGTVEFLGMQVPSSLTAKLNSMSHSGRVARSLSP